MDKTGEQLKTEGQDSALRNAGAGWKDDVLERLRDWCQDQLVLGKRTFQLEEFRSALEKDGFPAPPHHNAWGSVPSRAVKAGIIRATSMYIKAERPEAHARPVRIWEVRSAKPNQVDIFDAAGVI